MQAWVKLSREEALDFAEEKTASDRLFLWENEQGEIVSMVNIAHCTPEYARLNAVVTDRSHRCKGYGAMLVPRSPKGCCRQDRSPSFMPMPATCLPMPFIEKSVIPNRDRWRNSALSAGKPMVELLILQIIGILPALPIISLRHQLRRNGIHNDNEKMGNFISEMRRSQNLTQKELAAKLEITDKAISKWERGISCPDISLLIPLARILGVTTSELLNGRNAPRPKNQKMF